MWVKETNPPHTQFVKPMYHKVPPLDLQLEQINTHIHSLFFSLSLIFYTFFSLFLLLPQPFFNPFLQFQFQSQPCLFSPTLPMAATLYPNPTLPSSPSSSNPSSCSSSPPSSSSSSASPPSSSSTSFSSPAPSTASASVLPLPAASNPPPLPSSPTKSTTSPTSASPKPPHPDQTPAAPFVSTGSAMVSGAETSPRVGMFFTGDVLIRGSSKLRRARLAGHLFDQMRKRIS
ncbi:unnamed protein product [Vicia faba]|uniref:Uncharacterized protein n=1 Tax=Vicia faba TaxID=3906 RepID=A0AAV1ALB4_VICFA|nr:unnamed protein product [Vicia faba]